MRSQPRALSPQPWPWSGRARILVEHADEAAGLALASSLRHAGYAVAVCPGPESPDRCPLAGLHGCAIAHDADVVFFGLGLDSAATRDVLRALRASFPDTPVIAAVDESWRDEWTELLHNCHVVAPPVAPEELVTIVDRALQSRHPGG